MAFHDKTIQLSVKELSSDVNTGLLSDSLYKSIKNYGKNVIEKGKKRSFLQKFFDAFKEPMLIILLFGFVLALGTELGKFLKTGNGDFLECLGILLAIILSVSITLIMEGSSERAFNALTKIYDNISVRAVRNGKIIILSQTDVAVGDVLLLDVGDKIVADGRLLESNSLTIDESTLTGESHAVEKDSNIILDAKTPLAERINCVYSGTFVTGGSGKMLVTAVGNRTEIGQIAKELGDNTNKSPLQNKLAKLGKTITIIGAISAIIVFILTILRLYLSGGLDFDGVQNAFVSCIILIVAAVPEGLPTIVAISLALNMIKLAKENALIKKITATETAGAVSVICSDKTGTLTENKMKVVSICKNQYCVTPDRITEEYLLQNFVCNSTADVKFKKGMNEISGSATEGALIIAFSQSNRKESYLDYRNKYKVLDRESFSSDKKYMATTIDVGGVKRKLIKGAPEKVLSLCKITEGQKNKILSDILTHQQKARRVLCFAHVDFSGEMDVNEEQKFNFDGFVALFDPVRKDVKRAVNECFKAGIKVKILTGDNAETARAIAKELNLIDSDASVISAVELDKLDDEKFSSALKKLTVIARSTPSVKLRVVRALKSMGEVVAVTGDGINDAPAIKHADVGIAMGISGTEITKEAADVVLLDDSFITVVKAISFGRNVYKNLQRFILFQLSVNLSALLFITVCAIIGVQSPFNTLQLLWINVIMDGPPALTLGLESASGKLMNLKPVKRTDGLVDFKMLLRILFNGMYIGGIMLAQYFTNFLQIPTTEFAGAVFSMFILFQLFNAFNSRELGSGSIFSSIGKNKIMVFTFLAVFILHLLIVQGCPSLFEINSLSLISWIKTLAMSSSIVLVSEIYKYLYRSFMRLKKPRKYKGYKNLQREVVIEVNKNYFGA